MSERISYLIEYHSEKSKHFLTEKFNIFVEQENILFDRRKIKYNPPRGPHTPDRRVKDRRIWQAPNSPKRRKTDLAE